jgi:hypothetical protein
MRYMDRKPQIGTTVGSKKNIQILINKKKQYSR